MESSIRQWQEDGDQILLMAEKSEDIQVARLKASCTDCLYLVKGIAYLHRLAPTPTYQCNSKAIDSIFLSADLLEEAQGRFLNFGEAAISDHWALWLDSLEHQFGFHNPAKIKAPQGWWPKCLDSKKYKWPPQPCHKFGADIASTEQTLQGWDDKVEHRATALVKCYR